MIEPGNLKELFLRWYKGEADPEEERALFEALEGESPTMIDGFLQEAYQNVQPEAFFTTKEKTAIADRVLGRKNKTRVMVFQRIAIAAVFTGLLIGSYLIFIHKPAQPATAVTRSPKHDVAPGHDGAILTLTNGRQLVLDSTSNGVIAQQGNSDVVKQQNTLSYQTGSNAEQSVVYNTMTTPNGRQYSLVLADGSKVWLNAGSSITFPTAFIGKERKVQVTGEAYFEVAKNPAMPFRVQVNDMTVEVLGTHFNVNSYSDEDAIKTTLLEGAVKVTNGDKTVRLIPGQQSVLENNGSLSVNKDVNTDEIIAWKEGYFHFESADLPTILRQFARWYDVQVVYEGPIKPRKFFAIVKRSSSLNTVLDLLQDNDIKYRIENKKLIVKSG